MNRSQNPDIGRQNARCGCPEPAAQCDPPEFGLPLAMAYVPWQQWQEPYPCDMALLRGTIFPCLDLPFKGSQRRQCRG